MRSSLFRRAAACGLSVLAWLAAATAQPAVAAPFVFTRLPSLGGTESAANGINDAGDVVGESTTATGGRRAVMWRDGRVSDLGAGDGSRAFDINNRRVVVGGHAYAGFRWQGGVVVLLPLFRGNPTGVAASISDKDVIVGADDSYAVLWGQSGVRLLSAPPGVSDTLDYATGVNDEGAAVGCAWQNVTPSLVAILYTKNGSRLLPSALAGFDQSACAQGINHDRQAVGYSAPNGILPMGVRATRWDQGVPVLLDSEFDSAGLAINDQALAVGWASDAQGTHQAALWEGSKLVLLQRWLPPDLRAQGWVLTEARAVNASGAIAGVMQNPGSGESAAWLLTPSH